MPTKEIIERRTAVAAMTDAELNAAVRRKAWRSPDAATPPAADERAAMQLTDREFTEAMRNRTYRNKEV
jgi:hypothetical protein